MKIVYISRSIIPSRSANSIHVMKVCQALSKLGHDVTLITVDNQKECEAGISDIYEFYGIDNCFKIKKLPFFINKIGWYIYSMAAMRVLNNIKPDLVIGRSLHGCLFSTMLGYKTIFELHQLIKQNNKVFSLLKRNKNFEKLVVISTELKQAFIENNLIEGKKIQVIPDGADIITDFDPIKNWQSRQNTIQVGYVGHLYKGKGLEVIEQLAKKLTDIDFHIIGGSEKDINYWKERIKSSNVLFHGFIKPSLISKHINKLDICLLPNQKEVIVGNKVNIGNYTSPLKLFEYMANKKPVIASDLPVLREVLNENNSILVDSQNIEEWTSAIEKLKDINYRHKIADNGYNDFIEKYTWTKRAEVLIKLDRWKIYD